MHTLVDHDFLWQCGVGSLGLLLWFVKSRIDPHDDRVSSLFRGLAKHSLSFSTAMITYFLCCIMLREAGQLNYAAAIGAGFGFQSLFSSFMTRRNGNGVVPPPSAP